MSVIGTPVSAGDAGATTLGAVRALVRQRADMVNSTFCTDAEINSYIGLSAYELYDLLIQKYGDNYYVSISANLTTDGTNDRYTLPADLYKLLAVDLQVNTTKWVTLHRFNFSDRNKFSPYASAAFMGRTNLRYSLLGNDLWLAPLPPASQIIRLFYVPRLVMPVNDSDVIDGISGWQEYLIVDAAIRCLNKEESDCSVLMSQKQALIARIESAAENRDAGEPKTTSISDNGYGYDDPFSGGNGWGY